MKISTFLSKHLTPIRSAIILFIFFQLQVFNLGLNFRDEGLLYFYAQQAQKGLVPYRDFFMVLTPGTYYLQALINQLFGTYILSARLLFMAWGVLLLICSNLIFVLPTKWKHLTLLATAMIIVTPGGFALYTIESVTLSLLALLFLQKGKSKRTYFLAGVVSFLVFLFKQSMGLPVIPILFAAAFVWNKKQCVYFLIGFALSCAMYVYYYFSQHALAQMTYYVFFFASSVKKYQYDFITHRVVVILGVTVLLSIIRRLKRKYIVGISFIVVVAGAFYLLSSSIRMGRFTSYLSDPLFYIESALLLLPVIVFAQKMSQIGVALFEHRNINKEDVYIAIYTCMVFGLFFGLTSSGTGAEVPKWLAAIFLPYMAMTLEQESREKKTKVVYAVGFLLFIFLYVITIAVNPFNPQLKFYSQYSKYTLNTPLSLSQTKGIKVSAIQAKDIDMTVAFLSQKKYIHTPVICYPYCIYLLALANKQSVSYYNFFYSELFKVSNQQPFIHELERKKGELVILQKKGSIENEANNEDPRLAEVVRFFKFAYTSVYQNDDFVVLKEKSSRN